MIGIQSMDAARQSSVVRTGPGAAARWGRCSKFLLVWSLAEAVAVVVYVFAGRLWGFVVPGCSLRSASTLTCYYINIPPADQPRQGQGRQVHGSGSCLSQKDIEAMPAFEYRRQRETGAEEEEEECAVCISAVRDGETVRRLPACGHAFHARCIDGWLRAHATCPVCRAAVKVVAGEPPPAGAAAV